MSLISGCISLLEESRSLRADQFRTSYSSACATVLSMQIEQALEADQTRASKGRFIKIWDAEIEAFMKANTPDIDLQEFLDKVKLPTELVQKYLGQKVSSDPLQGFLTKEMTTREIRQYESEVSDTFELDLPSLEEVLSESHANAVREAYITTATKDFEEDLWPFNSMPEESKERVVGPYSYLASFGATHVASLLSLNIAQALEADVDSGEALSLERMGEICRKTAEKFIEANFEQPVNLQELLFEIELPTGLVQKYLTSLTFPEGCRTVSFKDIQQQMEVSEGSDKLSQELDEVLPSLESHLEEAHAYANIREGQKRFAEFQAAELAAQKAANTTSGQRFLSLLPSLAGSPKPKTTVAI